MFQSNSIINKSYNKRMYSIYCRYYKNLSTKLQQSQLIRLEKHSCVLIKFLSWLCSLSAPIKKFDGVYAL